MTGVDLSAEFLGHARAADPGGRVVWEQRDMRDLPWRDRFDGAFCYGNSFECIWTMRGIRAIPAGGRGRFEARGEIRSSKRRW